MAFSEDLALFTADFGVNGTLAGSAVRGIFDGPAVTQALGDGGATAAEPQYQLPTASVPANSYDAVLVIPQGTFRVREHLPDGTGMSLLILTKVVP